jgi:hypothetical protein
MADIEGHCSDEGVDRHDSMTTTRKRRRYGNSDRAGERDNHSLFGALTEDDGNDAARIRGARRQTRLAPRCQRGPRLFSCILSEDLISEEEEGCGHDDLILADRASRSDLRTARSSPKLQETKEMAGSNPNGAHLSADDGQDEPLLGYKDVNGKPLVLMPWYPTWEPPDDYSREEVERVKRQYESWIHRKRRGRPPLRVVGGISNGSLTHLKHGFQGFGMS